MKRRSTEWEKRFASDRSNKGSIFKIHEELARLSAGKPNAAIKKWAEDPSRRFSKEDIRVANGHVKRCSTSLIIGGRQTETTTRRRFAPVRMASPIQQHAARAGEPGERRDLSSTLAGLRNGAATLENSVAGPRKVRTPLRPSKSTSRYLFARKKPKTLIQKDARSSVSRQRYLQSPSGGPDLGAHHDVAGWRGDSASVQWTKKE